VPAKTEPKNISWRSWHKGNYVPFWTLL
jgi:hypothetical protein